MRYRIFKKSFSLKVLFVLTLFSITLQSFQYVAKSVIGNTISDFSLKNVDGTWVSLNTYPEAKGFIIIFTCNRCPFAKLYTGRLNDLNSKYKELHVPLLAVNSMDTLLFEDENFQKMQQRAKSEGFNFPYLCDNSQSVAKKFAAQKTPHAFVIWKENGSWIVKYEGAIDDNGAEPDKVKNQYIVNAVDDLLKGNTVQTKETKSVGCLIHFR